jgi:hypothetical protein
MLNGRNQTWWGAFAVIWGFGSLTFMLWLFANIVLGVIVGAFAGWLVSHSLLGHWIADGLGASGITTSTGELHKIGATVGFLSGFLKFSVSPPRRDNYKK